MITIGARHDWTAQAEASLDVCSSNECTHKE